jgi:ribosomal protein L11 methyltransferase
MLSMNHRVLWKLCVANSQEAQEPVAELLEARFGEPASIYTDLAKGETTVTAYLHTRPDWSKAARARLSQALKEIERDLNSSVARSKLTLTRLRSEDWAESWKRHFKPLEIGTRLLIKPSWSRRRAKRGQVTVVLDPGLSFGTGQHPTTSFCLRELARHRRADRAQSLLDIGTGSGILAISAAKLGYQPVNAIDLDRDAIRVACANARLNEVFAKIRFQRQDLTRLTGHSLTKYSVICANVTSGLLLIQRQRILGQLQKGGILILAGILKTEFDRVQAEYQAAGLRLVGSRTEREWRSGSFR